MCGRALSARPVFPSRSLNAPGVVGALFIYFQTLKDVIDTLEYKVAPGGVNQHRTQAPGNSNSVPFQKTESSTRFYATRAINDQELLINQSFERF